MPKSKLANSKYHLLRLYVQTFRLSFRTQSSKHLSTQIGLKPITPISILLFNHNIFSHVVSWRQQFHLPTETDVTKIPFIISITHNERTYRIFLIKGDFICFKYEKKGNKVKNGVDVPPIDVKVKDNIDSNDLLQQSVFEMSLSASSFPPLQTIQTITNSPKQYLIKETYPGPLRQSIQTLNK